MNYFKHKVDPEWDPECRFCLENDETFWHLATDCPVFWKERRDIFMCGGVNETEWDVDMVMKMANVVPVAKALEGYEEIYYDEGDDEEPGFQSRPPPEPD